MSRRLRLAGVFAVAALSAGAQVVHAPDGGVRETLSSIMISAKPGAPFRATVVTSWKRRLEDGTEVTVYNHRTVARDSTGRVFQERRYFAPDGNTRQTMLRELDYYDPARREMTVCVPMQRHCTVRSAVLPTDDPPPLPVTYTRPDGTKFTRESIGTQTVEALETQGSHEITVSPRLGEAEPTVKEFWYSPRLGINVAVRRFEPRGGAQDFSVQAINLTEPDPRLFEPPQDFGVTRMVQERAARPVQSPEPPAAYDGRSESGIIENRASRGGAGTQ